MKNLKLISILLFISILANAQTEKITLNTAFSSCADLAVLDTTENYDLGLIIYSDDVETVWNALRLALYSQGEGDKVIMFVVGRGLDAFMKIQNKNEAFYLHDLANEFWKNDGKIYSCATCAKARNTEDVENCTITGIADFYQIVKRSKKVLTF
ncbi:MAG: DsrE family protein [Prevotellaceae bacterium]|jgi:uncharacterized protein involved in oxidation of intracellular sulfur|nr:DsrE family protein [Prevotellaceae bacterium]